MESISPRFLSLAKKVLKNPVICDVGSRDALEGIDLANKLGARELHVFEPNPAAAPVCRSNLARLKSAAAHFNQAAVSDKVGRLKFYPVNPDLSTNKDIGFSSLFRLNPEYTRRRGSVVQDELTVDATTLDTYFDGRRAPDLLWIDAEGAELDVLRGASRVLTKVRLIHLEVSFRPMQIGKPLFWEIEQLLANAHFGFRGFTEISALRGFLYRRRLLPNLPWRLNAVFERVAARLPARNRAHNQ